jgi:hypothetical protein
MTTKQKYQRVYGIFKNPCSLFIVNQDDGPLLSNLSGKLYCGQWQLADGEGFVFTAYIDEDLYCIIHDILNSTCSYKLEFYEPNQGVLSRYPLEKTPEISTTKVQIEMGECSGKRKWASLIWGEPR